MTPASTSLILRGHPRPDRRRHGTGLVGLIDLAAGAVALAWPGSTALVLIVASWAVIAGLVEVAAAFGGSAPAGTRALFILGGLVSVAFGVVLSAHPGVGPRHFRRPAQLGGVAAHAGWPEAAAATPAAALAMRQGAR